MATQLLGLHGPELPGQRACECTSECSIKSARDRERESERKTAKVTWPKGRTGQCTIRV